MPEITMQELMERDISRKAEFSEKHGIANLREMILSTNNTFGIALTFFEGKQSYALYCRAIHDESTDETKLIRVFPNMEKAVAAFKALTV